MECDWTAQFSENGKGGAAKVALVIM